ncbi:MAG: class E sortase [Actinobacteria bacterium]|nr:class E sortase [Actinomycetota bacterium]
MSRIVRGVGWTLIAAGTVILLYLGYLLFYTNLTTDQAQGDLLEDWQAEYGTLPGEGEFAVGPSDDQTEARPADPGEAYAVMWFERPGSDEPVVRDGPLFVVEGVTLEHLKSGPGHYPSTAAPGHDGNFAISGHRTTYGAPFYHLDQLQEGDEIHVVDRQQREWVYVVRKQEIVQPTALWVIGDDPLETGRPTMTLTTCHPRFSAAERLIVFAELQGEAVA